MSPHTVKDENLVRCIACGRMYELGGGAGSARTSACPGCGSVSWVAVRLPLRARPSSRR